MMAGGVPQPAPDRRRPLDCRASLQSTATATTVHKSVGASPTVADGPFAETKERPGGFYMVKAADLDEAIELAKAIPIRWLR